MNSSSLSLGSYPETLPGYHSPGCHHKTAKNKALRLGVGDPLSQNSQGGWREVLEVRVMWICFWPSGLLWLADGMLGINYRHLKIRFVHKEKKSGFLSSLEKENLQAVFSYLARVYRSLVMAVSITVRRVRVPVHLDAVSFCDASSHSRSSSPAEETIQLGKGGTQSLHLDVP